MNNGEAILSMIRGALADFLMATDLGTELGWLFCSPSACPHPEEGADAGLCRECLDAWLANEYAGEFALTDGAFVRTEERAAPPDPLSPDVVRCRECRKDGLLECPLVSIERQQLVFLNHDPEWFCADGEREAVTDDEREIL